MKIAIWWHVCTINNWHEITAEQLGKMMMTNLWDHADRIFVGTLGDGEVVLPRKAEIVYRNADCQEREIATIRMMDTWAKRMTPDEAADWQVLYLHSKGAGRCDYRSQYAVSFWRRYMEYFVIERWRDCSRSLAACDACGVDLNFVPWPHFSGNFWWANLTYLRTLPDALTLRRDDPVRAELRIGESSREMALHCLWYSGQNLYAHRYTPDKYRGRNPLLPTGVGPSE